MKLSKLTLSVLLTGSLLLSLAFIALAQNQSLVQRAELAIPFGSVSGKIVLVADQLVFVDDERTESSFAIARADISDLKTEFDMVVITTKRQIRDRSGERNQFNFKLRDGSSEAIKMWAGSTSTTASTSTSTTAGSSEQWVYNAKHTHKIGLVPSGSCTGKLIVSRERVTYESLEDREHSRQWPLADIKKVKRNSPYLVEVEPFTGDKYILEIEGKGIDIDVYKKLTNWMSLARGK